MRVAFERISRDALQVLVLMPVVTAKMLRAFARHASGIFRLIGAVGAGLKIPGQRLAGALQVDLPRKPLPFFPVVLLDGRNEPNPVGAEQEAAAPAHMLLFTEVIVRCLPAGLQALRRLPLWILR
jgi:hypothetical protein